MKRIAILLATLFLLAACDLQGDALTIRTADERLTIGVRLLQPVPPVTIEPQVLPTEEPTATPTPECVNAKANINANDEHIYHLPTDANYNTVKIDKDGEAIYCTAVEAEAAGFRRALR